MFSQKGFQQDQKEGDNLVPGTYGSTMNIMCFNCNNYGHVAENCPEAYLCQGHRGSGFVYISFSLTLQDHDRVMETNCMIKEIWSTVRVCNNELILQDRFFLKRRGTTHCDKWKITDICHHGNIQDYLNLSPIQPIINCKQYFI